MKIIPTSDIAVAGVHRPAGEAFETADKIGVDLIAQGLARRAPVDTAPVVETAIAKPAHETTALKHGRKK